MTDLMDEGLLSEDGEGPSPSDDEVLQATAAGDRLALRILMNRYGRTMIALAQRTTGSPDDADEIVQEAFLKVWTMAPRWRVDGGAKFSTWLHRVVLNACLDLRRRRSFASLDEAGDPADPAPGAVDHILRLQRHAKVVAAMAELPERQRAALSLHYFSEISAPAAAEVMEVTLSAFESLLIRGKRALRAALIRQGITSSGDIL